jgi:predicted lipid-binding transport protein (Tim44 family)
MFRIRRFGVIRTANVVAFFYVVIIAIFVVPITLLVAAAAPSANLPGTTGAFAGNVGAMAVLFFGLLAAVFYGIFGWIFTALACLLYNFAARVIGGIEIQLEAVEPPPPTAIWSPVSPPSSPAQPPSPPAQPPSVPTQPDAPAGPPPADPHVPA